MRTRLLLLLAACAALGPADAQTPASPSPSSTAAQPEAPVYRLFFAWDSARVEGEGRGVLDRVVEDYRGNGRVTVEIIANADDSGPSAYNRRLSLRRARSVAGALVRRGIPRGVILLRPVGESRPLVATPDGVREAMNRYAEISFPAPVLR